MQLRLHNTLTRTKEAFEPIDASRVRLYVCGPTVYQRIHVGNARAFVVFDVLYRLLRHLYGEQNVVYVRNITDIDDKIIEQAAKNGEDIRALTDRTTADFHADLAALGCLPPTHEPRATEHVPGMIALIGTLIERGHAYAAEGHVLFSVPSMPTYGRLSGRNRDEQIAGARIDVAPYKRDPADFVLWKPSAGDQPGWDSPWGHGRPGWHIECSAMSEAFLAPLPFDIHAGGLDLIFPHHENEIAQSCCAHGLDTMARFWLHNGFLDMRGEKMSKSLGNVIRVNEGLDLADDSPIRRTEIIRTLMFGSHYRQPVIFDNRAIEQAKSILDRLYDALYFSRQIERDYSNVHSTYEDVAFYKSRHVEKGDIDEEVLGFLLDDMNTPRVLKRLSQIADDCFREQPQQVRENTAAKLLASGLLIGLLNQNPTYWRRGDTIRLPTATIAIKGFDSTIAMDTLDKELAELIALRSEKRKQRKYKEADEIRAELLQRGIILEDRPDGTTDWRRA